MTWTLEMHGLFQMYYYEDKLGLDKDGKDTYREHEFFNSAAKFCEKWNQMFFNPDYPTRELSYFEAMVYEIYKRPPFDPAIRQKQG